VTQPHLLAAPAFTTMLPSVLGSEVTTPRLDDTMTLGRLSGGDEVFGAVADQVPAPHLFQRFPQ
jgi:hypothetical protein